MNIGNNINMKISCIFGPDFYSSTIVLLTSGSNSDIKNLNASSNPSSNNISESSIAPENVDNSAINEIIQSLDDHITEIAYSETIVQLGFDPVDLILRRQRDEANQAKAGEAVRDARDAIDAIAAIDASAASVVSDAIVAIVISDASPPAYSPTRAWMYEPIITL